MKVNRDVRKMKEKVNHTLSLVIKEVRLEKNNNEKKYLALNVMQGMKIR
jgi:hypothetical protein